MTNEESTSLRVPVFNGEEKKFQSWWIKFQAYARVKGFHGVLSDSGITIEEEDIETLENKPSHGSGTTGARTADEEKQLKLGKKNLTAMAHLTMAFGTEALLNKISVVSSSDWPGGLAFQLVDLIKEKCAPKDRMAVVERTRKMNAVQLNKGADPANLFEQIKSVENQFSDLPQKLTENDKIAVVLEKAAEEYGVILSNTAREKGNHLAMDDLEDAMKIQWRITKGTKETKSESAKEYVLSAFTGKCYKCGKVGHKADKCPNAENSSKNEGNKSGGGRQFTGKCHTCGQTGHKAAQCWDDDKNAHLRPSWWKPRRNREKGLSAAEGSNTESAGQGNEYVLMTMNRMRFNATSNILNDPNVFIGDTGASSDTTASDLGFKNVKPAKASDNIVDASGNSMTGKITGDVSGVICDKYGSEKCDAIIKEMVYSPDAEYNLFSLTKRLEDGFKLGGDKNAIWISKGDIKITFDIKISTPKGAIFAVYFKRKLGDNDEVAAVIADRKKVINANTVHGLVGHMNDVSGRQVMKYLGYDIARKSMTPCGACAEAKAKQRSLPSRVETVRTVVNPKQRASVANGRIFLDISSVKSPKLLKVNVTKPNWRLMVDERTELKWTNFYDTKDEMVEPTCEMFHKWKLEGKPVGIVRCDNAGENMKLKDQCKSADWKLGIDFEWTARATPQQNSLVEVGFTTIGDRGRAMMIAANISYAMRFVLFKEAYACATLLDGLVVVEINGEIKTRLEHWGADLPKWTRALRTWGEAGVVKLKSSTSPKMANKGLTCVFVGYAIDHAEGVYRMWNPTTGRIHVSRDVVWLKRMYYQRQQTAIEIRTGVDSGVGESMVTNTTTPTVTPSPGVNVTPTSSANSSVSDEVSEGHNKSMETLGSYRQMNALVDSVIESESESESEENEEVIVNENESESATESATVTRSGRVSQPPSWHSNYEASYAAMLLTKAEQNYYANLKEMAVLGMSVEDGQIENEVVGVGAGLGGGFYNTSELRPMKFKEAMKVDREGWTKAVKEEHERMVTNGVWKAVKKKDVPSGAKILTSTWACKLKSNGTKRARINGRGYEQIDGVHYDSSSISSPVTNDATVRIIFVLGLMADWIGKISDVKGAFLKGDLDTDKEQMYMHVPEGFEEFYGNDELLQLLKAIYGTKQAAMAFLRELLKCMKDMKYGRSGADPCLYFKWVAIGLVVWVSWIDDCMCWGPKSVVPKENKEFMARFDCDDVGEVVEYVGCKIDRDAEKGSMKITQPVMIQSFSDEFETSEKRPSTPAEAGTVLEPCSDGAKVDSKRHTYFRKGVGKLLHMTRWSRPEVQNSVRELARHGSKPCEAHVKAMHRVMDHCKGTAKRGWSLNPDRKWDGKDKSFKFCVHGMSDSDFAKCPVTRRSVSGYAAFLEGAAVSVKSAMQRTVALSVTEAELIAAVQCAQDMLYIKKVLESMGLQVELPMVLKVDNSGAVDLANNWSAGGRTRHVETRMFFLRDLKEAGIIKTVWTKGSENPVDMFTKNLAGPAFQKCAKVFVGEDEYNGKRVEFSE